MNVSDKDDELAVLFCNPEDADRFIQEDPDVAASLAVTPIIPVGEAIVVPQEEFLTWLYGKDR